MVIDFPARRRVPATAEVMVQAGQVELCRPRVKVGRWFRSGFPRVHAGLQRIASSQRSDVRRSAKTGQERMSDLNALTRLFGKCLQLTVLSLAFSPRSV